MPQPSFPSPVGRKPRPLAGRGQTGRLGTDWAFPSRPPLWKSRSKALALRPDSRERALYESTAPSPGFPLPPATHRRQCRSPFKEMPITGEPEKTPPLRQGIKSAPHEIQTVTHHPLPPPLPCLLGINGIKKKITIKADTQQCWKHERGRVGLPELQPTLS